MNKQLKDLKGVVSENCITIILNTHRTHPDNKKDALTLKNLIKEVGERLSASESKRKAIKLMQRLNDLESSIDYNQNLESLILFVNENIAQYMRLTIPVENRAVIGNSFATRDIIRALHTQANYFVLVISQQETRLIEALNYKVVSEIGKPFPIINTQFNSTSSAESANAPRQTNLIAEFFNRIDKEVNKIRKDNPLPVLICTEESNYYEYLKIADQKSSIYGTFLNQNRLHEKADAIVLEAWKIVKAYIFQQNSERKNELKKAISQKKFLSDTNEIWQGIQQGRIQTLFIEHGNFQPAKWNSNSIEYVADNLRNKKEVADDIYDELIEENMKYGGDVVFLSKGELSKFNGFGAITRY